MSVAIQGGKVLADGKLTFDPGRKRYRLEGTAPKPRGGPVALEGALDATGKLLVLDQVAPAKDAGGGTIRLSVRPNSNFIRYTMWVDRKDADAVQFHRTTEVGLTKEGESLAGSSTAAERPMHRDGRRRHHDDAVPGSKLPHLLHGMPRRVQ